ncbi:MAG TPA: hypothetical protein ENO21_03380 [Firmicutes bacterium]|nr:hypothetical protein [Bacillota bacterium]
MKAPFDNLRPMAGMSLGRECAFYFWSGWLGWVVAAFGLIYVELTLRAPDHLAFYMVEAWLAVLAPFFALYFADSLSLTTYQAVWHDLHRRELGHRVIDREAVDRLREELRSNPLLRWFRPPPSEDSRAQLLTVSLWYRALILPPAAPWRARYGEWVADVCLGYLPFFTGWLLWFLVPAAWGFLLAVAVTSLSLVVLGLSAVRLAARRQAVLDYFAAWLQQGDPAASAETERET